MAGNLTTCLMLLKGLPLAYQRDLQETVPPLLDGAAALEASLAVLTGLVGSLEVDIERMASAAASGHTTATAVADSLVERGVPFRAAHEIVGSVVKSIERTGRTLERTEDGVWRGALAGSADPKAQDLATDAGLPAHLRRAATVEAALARPDVLGGTAPGRVVAALAAARQRLEAVAAKTG